MNWFARKNNDAQIGLQLYTVREAAKADFIGTLKQVAAIGYKGIEVGGYLGGLPIKELRIILDDLGLTVIGGHVGVKDLNNSFEATLEDNAALGARYIGTAWLPEEYRKDAASWQRAGADDGEGGDDVHQARHHLLPPQPRHGVRQARRADTASTFCWTPPTRRW